MAPATCPLRPFPLRWVGLLVLTSFLSSVGGASVNAAAGDHMVTAVPPVGASAEDLPLPYLGGTVTAVKISMSAMNVRAYGGADENNITVDIVGQGPVPFSISRFNRGDLSPRLQPRHPFAQSNLGVPAGSMGFASSSPEHPANQAWRPSVERGVMLASVAQNGQHWNDGAPTFYGTVACVLDSQGYGYSMTDGTFGNANPNLDVTVGKAGNMDEANIDVALAWFPYDQGWQAGYVSTPGSELHANPRWTSDKSYSDTVPADVAKVVRWGKFGASLELPGVKDGCRDGMLFVTSTDPGTENDGVNTVSVYFRKRRQAWRISQHEDSSTDGRQLADREQLSFAFVYIPFTAGGLIGGNIEGTTGRPYHSAGQFRSIRLAKGRYEIRIQGPPEPGSLPDSKTDRDGMLLLQVTGRDPLLRKIGSRSFLSYNHTSDGALLVEARQLNNGPKGEELFPLVDTDFSFAWIDFTHPLTPSQRTFAGAYFHPPPGSRWGFWSGFFAAVLLGVLVKAAMLSGLEDWLRKRQGRAFGPFGQEEEAVELGTNLLRSDYRFG